jgi:DNA-binding response OmpR family regulator
MPSGDRPKIIYLTSEYTETDFATARRHGADTLMMKPFDRELFLRPLVEAGIL